MLKLNQLTGFGGTAKHEGPIFCVTSVTNALDYASEGVIAMRGTATLSRLTSMGEVSSYHAVTTGYAFERGPVLEDASYLYVCTRETGTVYQNIVSKVAKSDFTTYSWKKKYSVSGDASNLSGVFLAQDASYLYLTFASDPGTGTPNISGNLLKIAKSDGSITWQRKITNPSTGCIPMGPVVDSSGNVYCAFKNGGTSGSTIMKFNSSGTLQWQKKPSGSTIINYSAGIDSSGDLYIPLSGTGGTSGLMKMSSSGAATWAKTFGLNLDSPPIVSGSTVIAAHSALGNTLAFDTSGTHLWAIKPDSGFMTNYPLALSGGEVVLALVGTGHNFYRIPNPTKRPKGFAYSGGCGKIAVNPYTPTVTDSGVTTVDGTFTDAAGVATGADWTGTVLSTGSAPTLGPLRYV